MDDATQPRSLTREELYAEVWQKPVAQLAKEFGLSDVGLAKLCRRHAVPLPYRGFWARKAAGQTPSRIPLPAMRKGIPATVRLDPKPVEPPTPPDPEIEQALAHDATFAADDRVPENLRGADPLVTRTRDAIEAGHKDDYGRSAARWNSGCPLNINVSASLLPRALRIAEAIIRGAVRRGYTVETPKEGGVAKIFIRGNDFGFVLEEPSKRIEEKPDPKHPDRWYRRYRYEPRGRLVLRLEGYGWKARNRWEDSTKTLIEARLLEFFQSLARGAIEEERREVERKADQARWRAQEALQAEYDEASEQVWDLVKRVEKADGLRRLLARFQAEGVDMSKPVGRHASWSDWVKEAIRLTDPIADIAAGEIKLGRWEEADTQ
jgi:hypothetical protein